MSLSPAFSDDEVVRRLAAELPSSKQRGLLMQAWGVVRAPMFLLLLACGAVYLMLGEPQEAVMLLGFVFVVIDAPVVRLRKR